MLSYVPETFQRRMELNEFTIICILVYARVLALYYFSEFCYMSSAAQSAGMPAGEELASPKVSFFSTKQIIAGIVFAIIQELQIPVAYITFGENLEAIKCFDEAIRLDKDNQIVYAENKARAIKEQEENNV